MNGQVSAGPARIEATIPYNSRKEFELYGRSVFDQDNPANTTFIMEPRSVPIINARRIQPALTLESAGIELRHLHSKVSNFYDREEVQRTYFPEVEALLKQVTGATKVMLFGCVIRSNDLEKMKRDSKLAPGEVRDRARQGPAGAAHIDYTLESALAYIEDLTTPAEAARLSKRRFSQINIWKGIHRVERSPLAVCDGSSIAEGDLMIAEVRNPQGPKPTPFRTGYQVMYNPNHRWYYYPQMEPNEILLFKLVDSDSAKVQRVGHTAFEDPLTPSAAPARESIEVRSLCFY